jgi:sugar phosphate isomerase/epimerase
MGRFGISQFTTTPWPFELDLVEYPRAGASWIEICEFKLDRADYAPQLEAVARAGMRVSSVQSTVHAVYPDSLAPSPLDPEFRVRHIERSMERIAPYVPAGTPFVVISGAAPDGDNARVYATLLEVLPRLADRAAQLGVRLAFEPLNPVLFHTDTAIWGLDAALELVERINHEHLGICVDTWNIFQTPDLLAIIERAREKIFVVQISDWERPRSNADRRSLGKGTIPTRELLLAVERAGYSGPYVLEIFSEESLPNSLWAGDIAAHLRCNGDAFAALAAEVLA